MQALVRDHRGPKTMVLENVYGTLRSNRGQDFLAIGTAFADLGYQFGGIIVNAMDFIPQSRPRLFIIGIRPEVEIPASLVAPGPIRRWHPKAVTDAFAQYPATVAAHWVWWNLPTPPQQDQRVADLLENTPTGVQWHTPEETQALLAMMSQTNLAKVLDAQKAGIPIVGTLYRRTRNGVQRAEVRFDGISGCLRTPTGGSSRQTVMVVDADQIRSRLLSPREAARLMGLPDSYRLPVRYHDAYHLAGDGVAVPVVRFLAHSVLEPIVAPTLVQVNT